MGALLTDCQASCIDVHPVTYEAMSLDTESQGRGEHLSNYKPADVSKGGLLHSE